MRFESPYLAYENIIESSWEFLSHTYGSIAIYLPRRMGKYTRGWEERGRATPLPCRIIVDCDAAVRMISSVRQRVAVQLWSESLLNKGEHTNQYGEAIKRPQQQLFSERGISRHTVMI